MEDVPRAWRLPAALACVVTTATVATAQTPQTIVLRGREQTLRLYGPPEGQPIIVSSGDALQ